MARILCITSRIPGILYPTVELARRLRLAGHQLIVGSFAEARPLVAAHGLEFLELEPDRMELSDEDRFLGFFDRLRRLESRRRQALTSSGIDALEQRVRQVAPDLLLIDGEMHEQIFALWNVGTPIVLLNAFVSIWRRPGLPPPHRRIRPGLGWRGSRLGIASAWWQLRLKKRLRALVSWRRRVGCDRLSLLRRLARRTGLDWRRDLDAGQWLMPFTYRNLPVLSLHALEFEFPHTPPSRVCYTGPMVLGQRADPRVDGASHRRLDTLVEANRRAGRTLIYAAFGSFLTTDPGLLHRLVAAVAGRDDWELVLSLGGRADPTDLGPLPERVHAFRWLAQLDVLRHAAVVVTHGGINTLDECVLAGVPVLIYCGHETDMAGNTARVEHHGLGIAGNREDDTPETLRRHLDRLLREPRFRQAVERMGDHYRAYGDRAERFVAEQLTADRRSST